MWNGLKNYMEPIAGIRKDFASSLKDFYYNALDDVLGTKDCPQKIS
jgi:hypothetical protein